MVPGFSAPEVVCVVMAAETVIGVLASVAASVLLAPEQGCLVCVQGWRHRFEEVRGRVRCGGSCLGDGCRRIWRSGEAW